MRRDARPYWLKRFQARRDAAWARRYLHPAFDAIGEGCAFINPRQVEVIGPDIRIGKMCHINAEPLHPTKLCVWFSGSRTGRIDLGDYVLISPGTRIISSIGISIGTNTMVASDVYISDSDWHDTYDRTAEKDKARPISIGENVWIGFRAVVGKGVSIGRNSIVGAQSVVTRDIPANVIAAGNPAVVVKELDPDGPWRTRADFFADPAALDGMVDALDRAFLKRNTLLGYLRARWFPRPQD